MAVGAESETLLRSNFGTNAVEVSERTCVAILKPNEVARALRGDEKVISESSGGDLKAPHKSRPW